MAAASSYFDVAADVGSDEDEENNYDQETGEPRPNTNGKTKTRIDDSSDDEEDDDDEEAAAEIAKGFIADEEELDQDEQEARRQRRRERKKRRREEREQEDEGLDEDDLDIIGIAPTTNDTEQSKFKRLKRGHRDDGARAGARGVEEIFEDEDEADERRPTDRPLADEFDDFIEEDEFPDEEKEGDDVEIRRPAKHGFRDPLKLRNGLDEAAQEDMLEAFGNGTEYEWALERQEEEDAAQQHQSETQFELKDVFEPSQLIDKMLTAEDEVIRSTDIPERYQLAWKAFTPLDIDRPEQEVQALLDEEAEWLTGRMSDVLAARGLDLRQAFKTAVQKVLYFMNVDKYEVPFIISNRKDYLIHEVELSEPDPESGRKYHGKILLETQDLWTIQELDLEYKALVEKRQATQVAYQTLQTQGIEDPIIDEMIAAAVTAEELQDVQEYLHFQYSAQLKDVAAFDGANGVNGTQKRARSTRVLWERLRASQVYNLISALGITADALAENALRTGQKHVVEDPATRPDDMADSLVTEGYTTGTSVLAAAKTMFAEELYTSPRMRKLVRETFYMNGVFDCIRTDKGLRRIDEGHPDYKLKYLRDQEFPRFLHEEPEMFLQMLRAEQDGLLEVKLRLRQPDTLKQLLYTHIISDNVSDVADAWNALRREAVDIAVPMLSKLIIRGCKESLRTTCEAKILDACRAEYLNKLNQAPYKPAGNLLGVIPRVLALSNGAGQRNDAVCWAFVDVNGAVVDNGKFVDIKVGDDERGIADTEDVAHFVKLLEQRVPDVVAVSGWSVETRRLHLELEKIVAKFDIQSAKYDDDLGDPVSKPVEVHLINDEIARMYHTSARAAVEHPALPSLTRYCVALGKYCQSPLKQYAALGRDVLSIPLSPHQHLVSQAKLLRYMEMAMVQVVNLVGVEVNEAMTDAYTANLLPYVCGLGPRKANYLIQQINRRGGTVVSRVDLTVLGPQVWQNCASFLFLDADGEVPPANPLDSTRIHPEDYALARKMICDALEMDEEDAYAEEQERGEHAVALKLIKDHAQENVQELLLDDYADDILNRLGHRKRATLIAIRDELQTPFEELRATFYFLSSTETFTMLTGETTLTLSQGMVVPVSVKKTFNDRIEVKLDCGLDGTVMEMDFPRKLAEAGLEPRQVWSQHQTIQAKLLDIDYKLFSATLSLRESDLRDKTMRDDFREPGQWDDQQEAQDARLALKETEQRSGRAQRVIKHPLFKIMNSAQAEEFLGTQDRGDVVIRPSSKGTNHLAITWKVSDNVYQHMDVLELDKENEFSVGKTLKVGASRYSDLDELIVLHVKAMARKVGEMMSDEKFQSGSKAQTGMFCVTISPQSCLYMSNTNSRQRNGSRRISKRIQRQTMHSASIRNIRDTFTCASRLDRMRP